MIKSLLIKHEELSKLLKKKIIGNVPRQDGNFEFLYIVKKKKEAQKE